jgi:maleylpyruvate isomerase
MTTRIDARGWADTGTQLVLAGLGGLTDDELDAPCALPGWTRRHLLAHLASNAEAIGRLLTWARTGVKTPMYASPDQRADEIAVNAGRPDLPQWVRDSASRLSRAMNDLPDHAWHVEVVTAQGRTVPAGETAWMRARETCVHAVDLGTGTTFADLPDGFLAALIKDVTAWRSARPGPSIALTTPAGHHEITGDGPATRVELPIATAAAWLVGRHPTPDLPNLPNWL